jgi:hypothetical protein
VATNKVKTTKLCFPSFFIFGFGMEKIRIRNKYLKSTTLVEIISDFERKSGFYVNNRELGKIISIF